ncbi:hypothetical protein [Geopseudomonas aromaticivorans]
MARVTRDQVIGDLEDWQGDVLVLDGFLSDELPDYPDLQAAINDALKRAPNFGERLEADDPEHAEIALSYLQGKGVALDTPISLTGAWYDPTDQSGCINATVSTLSEAGFTNLDILESAAELDFYGEGVDDEPDWDSPAP